MGIRNPDRKETIVAISFLVLVLLVSIGIALEDSGKTETSDWKEIKLEDVNSGDKFKISELDKPVLVETFAVWCPTCTRQQQEIKKLHERSNVTSVSLDVDPNEDQNQIRRHTEQNGFNWRYAISPPEMTRALINEYGNSLANPPSAPAVLVCENSTRKLQNGVKPVSKLEQEVQEGC